MLNRGNTIAILFVGLALLANASIESASAQTTGPATQQNQVQKLTPEQQQQVERYKAYQQQRYEQEVREQQARQAQQQQVPNTNQQTNQQPATAAQQHLTPQQLQELRIQQQANRAPQLPPEYANQSAAEKKYINDMLDRWQASSRQVKRFTTKYTRWDYSPEFVNWRDPQTQKLAAQTITIGEIRYQTPDKGMFESDSVWDFEAPPQKQGEQPKYKQRKKEGANSSQEKWICDGQKIYEYEYQRKVLYETDIPADMQGKGLVNSPIPFLFGAEKKDILERFWVRVVTPKEAKNELWLEAYPKRITDARNYKKLEVIISGEDFLPKGLHIYATNYDAAKNPVSRYFAFENRKVNDFVTGLQAFSDNFIRPSLKMGWKRMNRMEAIAQEQQQLGAAQPASLPGAQRTATAPANQNGARK